MTPAEWKDLYLRILTFYNWPGTALDKDYLARSGFFHLGDGSVMCAYCRGYIERWNEDDDPIVVHARRFPCCAFILNLPPYAISKEFV
jgi:hypothetical protein